MLRYLLLPSDVPSASLRHIPLVRMAYAVDREGHLLRRNLPAEVTGGQMGIVTFRSAQAADTESLSREILAECALRHFRNIYIDCREPAAFIRDLAEALRRGGHTLFLPEEGFVPGAVPVISTALSGGSLRDRLTACVHRFGECAAELERLRTDFTLPAVSGTGCALSEKEFAALYDRFGTPSYFSRELCAKYFTYFADGRAHFVLFDDTETILEKQSIAQSVGIRTAFLRYDTTSDLLSQLFPA